MATWVAVRDGLAGEPFGWDLGVEPLPGFFVGPGTALSGPLVMLLALVVANLLLRRGGRAHHRGATILTWLGVGFLVGMLAEPVTWDPGTWRYGPVAALVLANLLLPLTLVILASQLRAAGHAPGPFGQLAGFTARIGPPRGPDSDP